MRASLVALCLLAAACSKNPPAAPEPDSADRATHWQSPPPASAPAAASAPAPANPPAPASAPAPAPAPTPAPAPASAAAPADRPLPDVKVANIGMHIGGGPNDDVTKEPIRKSVEPHFDEFRRCWALQDDTSKSIDFGVDLHIDREGGKAKADHPRTASKSKPFQECVVNVFLGIDFRKPKTGTTTVSYSLRFSPGK